MAMASKGQIDRFLDAARELGCDEDEAAFDDKLRKVAGGAAASASDTHVCQEGNGSKNATVPDKDK